MQGPVEFCPGHFIEADQTLFFMYSSDDINCQQEKIFLLKNHYHPVINTPNWRGVRLQPLAIRTSYIVLIYKVCSLHHVILSSQSFRSVSPDPHQFQTSDNYHYLKRRFAIFDVIMSATNKLIFTANKECIK
jgi:hypothetical protein